MSTTSPIMMALLKARKPKPPEDDGADHEEGLQAAAEDLIRSVNDKDASGVASSLKNAFSILDAMPGEEGNDEE